MDTGTRVFIRASLVLLIGASVFLFFMVNQRNTGPEIPDEKAAGVALLAEKLSGPGYFQSTAAPEKKSIHISRDDAIKQIARVLAERHWEASRAQELETLVERVTEPPPYRMLGEDHVNLVRLNLALDALH